MLLGGAKKARQVPRFMRFRRPNQLDTLEKLVAIGARKEPATLALMRRIPPPNPTPNRSKWTVPTIVFEGEKLLPRVFKTFPELKRLAPPPHSGPLSVFLHPAYQFVNRQLKLMNLGKSEDEAFQQTAVEFQKRTEKEQFIKSLTLELAQKGAGILPYSSQKANLRRTERAYFRDRRIFELYWLSNGKLDPKDCYYDDKERPMLVESEAVKLLTELTSEQPARPSVGQIAATVEEIVTAAYPDELEGQEKWEDPNDIVIPLPKFDAKGKPMKHKVVPDAHIRKFVEAEVEAMQDMTEAEAAAAHNEYYDKYGIASPKHPVWSTVRTKIAPPKVPLDIKDELDKLNNACDYTPPAPKLHELIHQSGREDPGALMVKDISERLEEGENPTGTYSEETVERVVQLKSLLEKLTDPVWSEKTAKAVIRKAVGKSL